MSWQFMLFNTDLSTEGHLWIWFGTVRANFIHQRVSDVFFLYSKQHVTQPNDHSKDPLINQMKRHEIDAGVGTISSSPELHYVMSRRMSSKRRIINITRDLNINTCRLFCISASEGNFSHMNWMLIKMIINDVPDSQFWVCGLVYSSYFLLL